MIKKAFLTLGILFSLYQLRWVFFYKFDPVYWENYYYESQWNVPNSSRQIGDEGVYRYIGYRLANGENPFNVDYWVPPFGKHLYGLGAKYLSNPYLTSVALYLLIILAFHQFYKDYLLTSLFALNPLLVEQLAQTMLDLPLTLFFLLHLLFFKSNKLVLSGLFLGIAAGTKPALFVPLFFAIASLRYLRSRQFKPIFILGFFTIAGYILSYFPTYFLYHPNPIPWLRLHDKVIAFHTSAGGVQNHFSVLITIFTGRYHGFWQGAGIYPVLGWSVVFALALLSILKSKKLNDHYYLLLVGYLGMNMLINFYPRYLLPILPLSLFLLHKLKLKRPNLLYLLVFATYLPQLHAQFYKSEPEVVETYESYLKVGQFKEAHQMHTSANQLQFQPQFLQTRPKYQLIYEHGQPRVQLSN